LGFGIGIGQHPRSNFRTEGVWHSNFLRGTGRDALVSPVNSHRSTATPAVFGFYPSASLCCLPLHTTAAVWAGQDVCFGLLVTDHTEAHRLYFRCMMWLGCFIQLVSSHIWTIPHVAGIILPHCCPRAFKIYILAGSPATRPLNKRASPYVRLRFFFETFLLEQIQQDGSRE